jgi:hypothetical protein
METRFDRETNVRVGAEIFESAFEAHGLEERLSELDESEDAERNALNLTLEEIKDSIRSLEENPTDILAYRIDKLLAPFVKYRGGSLGTLIGDALSYFVDERARKERAGEDVYTVDPNEILIGLYDQQLRYGRTNSRTVKIIGDYLDSIAVVELDN